ncbi:hypothetical protein [Nocardia sp. A7]|uniref:hypothetical protein n=1 Tax=Nocardia sp. A7 TaxID=2789274 RepID=UPI00397BE0FD
MVMGRGWTGFDAAALQRATGQSVREFAERLGVDPKTVSNWRSRGHSVELRSLTTELLEITLGRVNSEQRAEFLRIIANPSSLDTETIIDSESPYLPTQSGVDGWAVHTPAGRFYPGASTPTVLVSAQINAGRVLASTDAGLLQHPVLARPQRGLVVAVAVAAEETPNYFALDRRRVRARLAASNPGAPILIPTAYRLDDFSYAILWAVTNLDDALLDDDAELSAAENRLVAHDPAATVEHVAAQDSALSTVSRMWLGSHYCARHILAHLDQLRDAPAIWTREQRGEEAATWLLFAHKYRYLATTAARFAGTGTEQCRVFCIPPDAVAASKRAERVLMLLAAALIESVDITVVVCSEPEYTATHGFVLDPGRRAIVASWANTDHVRVDVTDHRPTLREYSDATGWARAHTVLAAAEPGQRLRHLADYLELDWTWVTTRAREFADTGAAGLSPPRSRLLTLTGVDHACRFLGDLAHQGR